MNAAVDTFLQAFFGDGNQISLEQAESTPALKAMLARFTPRFVNPGILPRRLDDRVVEWFVLCADDATLRRTQSEVSGFIGPTYARWEGVRANLRSSDPVEAAVLAFCGDRAIRFRTNGDDEFKACWAAIQLMQTVWNARPEQRNEQIRSGAALVREFDLALAGGDTQTAGEALGELRRRGLLGAENLRFLEIRQLAAQGRWNEIAQAADLPDLAKIRRPWLVTEDILTALYRSRLRPYEAADDPTTAIAQTKQLTEDLPELLTTRGPLESPDVLKLFALHLAGAASPDVERITEFAQSPHLQLADRDWIRRIAQAFAQPAAPVAVKSADLLNARDIDGAFRAAIQENDPAGVEVLIQCAYELQTLEAATAALDALDSLDAADRERVTERRLIAKLVKELRELTEPPKAGDHTAPTSWVQWFDRLLADPQWKTAEAVAVCGELEYGSTDLADADAAHTLAGQITAAADSERRAVLRDALPHIVGWLERQAFEPAITRPIYVAVLTVIALDDTLGDATLEVAYNCTEGVLTGGVDSAGYKDLLEQLGLLWDRMAARRHVAWLADILELLELFPGPRETVITFAAPAIAAIAGGLSRTSEFVRDGLRHSLAGVGAVELANMVPVETAETAKDDNTDVDLNGKLVGIYTLTPQVAVRAKQAIENRFPGVRVEINHDHVSTAALEHLSSTADYLIVSIRSAKHAATDAIDRCRPESLPTLIPGGRGSSRMLEALSSAVD